MSPSLSTTSWFLARALSSFWRGPHFFWLRLRWVVTRPVCERPMRSAATVTPLSEYSDSGDLPHRLLIGALSLFPPLSLLAPLTLSHSLSLLFSRSLALFLNLSGRSLFLTVFPLQLACCLPPSANYVYISAPAPHSFSVS